MPRVLVVDNSAERRVEARTALEAEGHVVDEASSGAEGLARAAECRPDVVVTGLYMEGMEGVEFLTRIRRAWPLQLVIVMSSRRRPNALTMQQVVRLLGAADVIDRPPHPRELTQAVSRALRA